MAKIIKTYAPITSYAQSEDLDTLMLIDEYIDKVGTGFHGPYICVVNEKPISRKHWGSLIIQKNDVVMFLAFPQGGGEGGSNPIKSIAMIAVMAAAMTIPGMAIFAGGMFAAGTFGGALMSGAIMFGGSYLLNLAFPPEPPEQVSESGTRSGTSLSSYNINDRSNNSALGNVITVQYGKMKHYPKYAMQSWSEYVDNEQYAYLLFCQGQGQYFFEEFNFGNVSYDQLSNIEINIFDNNGTVELNSDNVTWEHRDADDAGSAFLNGVHYNGSSYVSVGSVGEIQMSDNGITWTQQFPDDSYVGTFLDVCYGLGLWLAVGGDGEIQTSPDRITWTHRDNDGSTTAPFFTCCFMESNQVFVIAGQDKLIQTSYDGITWTSRTAAAAVHPNPDFLSSVASDDLIVIAGDNKTVQTSPDGITWTNQTALDDLVAVSYTGITYKNNLYVIAGDDFFGGSRGTIQTSPDGITWTKQLAESLPSGLRDVDYNGSIFTTCGSNGNIFTSPDGVIWTQQTPAGSFSGVFYSISKDVVTGATAEIQQATSGTQFYDNVFTSDQVQNIEVKRVDDYSVVATYAIPAFPTTAEKLQWIDSTVGSIPFTNGIYGNETLYDGFAAGDRVIIEETFTTSAKEYRIKSSYYGSESGVNIVAYELDIAVPGSYVLTFGSSIVFVPDDTANGYLVPNTNSIMQKASVDISFPNGLYQVNQSTGDIESVSVDFAIEYKEIPASGVEPASWSDTGTQTVSEAVRSPLFKTYDIPIASDLTQKIRVRINRDYGTPDEYVDKDKAVTTMSFSNLKVFLPDTSNYGDVSMIAVKVKTTNSLIQASLSQFNTVSTRKLPIYTTSWSGNTTTRNPAWAIADACRNSEYSLGIADADIDIDELVTLAAIWASRGDYCDGLFENKEVFWDSLRKICKVGRAQPLMIAGAVGFVRDQPKTIPVQVFTSENIQVNTFNVDYIPFDNDTPNSVELEYFDEDEWIWKKTLQTIPGGDTTQPASLQKWGIITEAHAIREAKYESACNAYRRKLPNFTTELEGRILKRLDYISVSSPRVGWGVSGHIANVDGNELELSQPVEFVSGSYYITFREKNGSQDGPYLVTEVTDEPNKVLMGTTPPSHIYFGYEYEKTHFSFGQGTNYDRKALVSTVQPQQLESVQITCIIDDERVYTADGTTGS